MTIKISGEYIVSQTDIATAEHNVSFNLSDVSLEKYTVSSCVETIITFGNDEDFSNLKSINHISVLDWHNGIMEDYLFELLNSISN
jgi:hypothetical protein